MQTPLFSCADCAELPLRSTWPAGTLLSPFQRCPWKLTQELLHILFHPWHICVARGSCPAHIPISHPLSSDCSIPSPDSKLGQHSTCLVLHGPNAEMLLVPHGFQNERVWPSGTCSCTFSSVSPLFQLKVDEFESNVNEIKDPYPSADFPGKTCPWQGSRKAEEVLQRGGV